MADDNVLAAVPKSPRDVRGATAARDVEQADEVVYRLGLHCLPVPGLPVQSSVDDVAIEFVRGPVRTQQTEIRQRHGLPFEFDKHMRRDDVGAADVVAVFSVCEAPVPSELNVAFARWRARALAAAGLVSAVLDERVAAHELFVDALLLRAGALVAMADVRGEVRTYLPYEVNTADRHALEQLKVLSLSETSPVARAARLYRRAALEGPTADAFAMLWVAAECFSSQRSPSRKEIEQALIDAGLDPQALPVPVSRLIDLRGKVQHHGVEVDERIRIAFYEMEAVVRALVRHHAGLRGGWWPASDDPAAFVDPFNHAVSALRGSRRSHWHSDAMPAVAEPSRLRIPRKVAKPSSDPRLDLDPAIGEALDLVASIVIDGIEWQDPEASLAVSLQAPDGAPAEATVGASATCIWFESSRLERLDDAKRPELLVNFIWDLHALVGAAIAQRQGLISEGTGVATVEAVGAYAQYRRLITHGQFEARVLTMPRSRDLVSLGKLAGWPAADDKRARRRLRWMIGSDRRIVRAVAETLDDMRAHSPEQLLDVARRAARAEGHLPPWWLIHLRRRARRRRP